MTPFEPRRVSRHADPLAPGRSFDDYQDARGRFLETLRRDWECRRLEAAWRLPPHEPGEAGEDAAGPGRGAAS